MVEQDLYKRDKELHKSLYSHSNYSELYPSASFEGLRLGPVTRAAIAVFAVGVSAAAIGDEMGNDRVMQAGVIVAGGSGALLFHKAVKGVVDPILDQARELFVSQTS